MSDDHGRSGHAPRTLAVLRRVLPHIVAALALLLGATLVVGLIALLFSAPTGRFILGSVMPAVFMIFGLASGAGLLVRWQARRRHGYRTGRPR